MIKKQSVSVSFCDYEQQGDNYQIHFVLSVTMFVSAEDLKVLKGQECEKHMGVSQPA